MLNSRHCALLLFACVTLGAPANAGQTIQGPVAVLPFKNLNRAADQDWMSAGIAETLLTDIRKKSRLTVVEREQLDLAMSELAFQENRATDASTAAAVGRIVGAKMVVLGSYQQAGKQLRITARFVEVETGIVRETAKATGSLKNIFSLQDELVRKLLRLPSPAPKKAVKSAPTPSAQPRGASSLEAYKIYSSSLLLVSQQQRVAALKKALAVDPHFTYAAEDLRALETRMKQHRKRMEKAMGEQAKVLYAQFSDRKISMEKRSIACIQLYTRLIQSAQHRAAVVLGEKVYKMDWPSELAPKMRPLGLSWMVRSSTALKQPDIALQLGEQFLQEFPESVLASSITSQMQEILRQKHLRKQAKERVDQELLRYTTGLRQLEYQTCRTLFDHHAYERAAEACFAFSKQYQKESDTRLRQDALRAHWYGIKALYESGQFLRAQQRVKQLMQAEPQFAVDSSIPKIVHSWPQE